MTRNRYNSILHWLAVATAVATFPLIFMGGLVTSHHAGMSVPDWPNTYGYNMFLFPPSHWVGGILYEHTHRLMGSVVGLLAMLLCGWAWAPILWSKWHSGNQSGKGGPPVSAVKTMGGPPMPQDWLALAVLGGVIFQGVLGGLRVVLVRLDLAIAHACVAQAFFCLAALAALVTSRWWDEAPDRSCGPSAARGRRLFALGMASVAMIYLQLIVGATMRHYDAGLAIPDLPLAYGKLLPPASHEALREVNHYRAWQLNLDPVTLPQIWLHFGHRVGAILVSLLVVCFLTSATRVRIAALGRRAALLGGLLALQLTLGILTVLAGKPADLASAHVAVGALVLVTCFVTTVRAGRIFLRRSIALAKSDESAMFDPGAKGQPDINGGHGLVGA